MLQESNARLLPPRSATRYTSAKTTWVRQSRAAIEITVQGTGAGVLPIWIPYNFLRVSGDCTWNYVLSVCAAIVEGDGCLVEATSGTAINIETLPTAGRYVYCSTRMFCSLKYTRKAITLLAF